MISADAINTDQLSAAAQTIRRLAVDAIVTARSGHVGLPLGCAELGALLYGRILKHDPGYPDWPDRDRFVLSAGHGSMLLYASLHLSGYDISLDDIRAFRSLGSSTPGHPEKSVTPGVETTTGPLGQGLANAVGMAIAERMSAAQFNASDCTIVDHYTYVLSGDGDLMEGVAYEASSVAAHLGLGKLIVFFDSNAITIDGGTELAFSEDIPGRFHATGWQVLDADAYDPVSIETAVAEAKADESRPALIVVESLIGRGLPRVQGTAAAHGGPLSASDADDIRAVEGDSEPFQVDQDAYDFFGDTRTRGGEARRQWNERIQAFAKKQPELYAEWRRWTDSAELAQPAELPAFERGDKVATRVAGGEMIQKLRECNMALIGGSADLTVPCFGPRLTIDYYSRAQQKGWYLPYGVREHAMGAITNGIALHGGFRVFCGTFLAFSDYMRPSIRLAALMRLPIVYVFTHDSVRIGEDGPTHQPVEHLASLRAMPGLTVLRPADALETIEAWRLAAQRTDGPIAILLTRHDVEVFPRENPRWRNGFANGAYVVAGAATRPELVIVASGSEVPDALAARALLSDHRVRVVSMPCRESFLTLPFAERDDIVPPDVPVLVVEAGSPFGWHEITRAPIEIIGMTTFGESGPAEDLARHFGFTAENIEARAKELLKLSSVQALRAGTR